MAEKKKENQAVLERTYTVPLRSAFRNAAPHRKTNRAVGALRAFLAKHMKSEDVRLGQHLNAFLWAKGIKSPPPRVTVKAVKDSEGTVRAELEGKTYKESVKPLPKDEGTGTIQDKISSAIGGKKGREDDETPAPTAEPKAKVEAAPKTEPKANSKDVKSEKKPAVEKKE